MVVVELRRCIHLALATPYSLLLCCKSDSEEVGLEDDSKAVLDDVGYLVFTRKQ